MLDVYADTGREFFAPAYGSYSVRTTSVPRKTNSFFEHGLAIRTSKDSGNFTQRIPAMAVTDSRLLLVRVVYSSDTWAAIHDVDTLKTCGYRVWAKRNGYPY